MTQGPSTAAATRDMPAANGTAGHGSSRHGSAAAEIAVALVEPERLIRQALSMLLNTIDGMTVVVQVASARELPDALGPTTPNVVLLSLDHAVEDRIASLSAVVTLLAERGRALVLTGDADPDVHVPLIECGAMGVLLKDQTADALGDAIRTVHSGEMWLDRKSTTQILRSTRRTRSAVDEDTDRVASLTAREREVVALVAEGLTQREIASRLFVSAATVRNHLTSILRKLELPNCFQLAVFAFRRGLVLCPPNADRLRMSVMMNGDARGADRAPEPRMAAAGRRRSLD